MTREDMVVEKLRAALGEAVEDVADFRGERTIFIQQDKVVDACRLLRYNELMVMQVMVNLPEETYRRAKRLAQLTRREVADVLADTLSLSLPSLADGMTLSIQVMADDHVLALTKLQLSLEEDARLGALLEKHQAGELTDDERPELNRLMQVYQEGLLLKSEALAEAVFRGLVPPLSS